MPEFIPRLHLPEGLAERVLAMMQQGSKNQPGVAAIDAVRNILLGGISGYAKEKMKTEERTYKAGVVQKEATTKEEAAKSAFGREQVAKQAEYGREEAVAGEKEYAAQIRHEEDLLKGHVRITQPMWDSMSADNKKKLSDIGAGIDSIVPESALFPKQPAGRMSGGVERGTPEWNKLRDAIISKKATLDQAFRGFNQAQRQYMIADVLAIEPEFSFPVAEGIAAGKKGIEAYVGTQQAQRFIKTAEAVLPQLKRLDDFSKDVSRTQINMVNKGEIAAANEFGSVNVRKLKTQTNQLALNMQRLYPTGSDEKLKLDLENLNAAQTVEQLTASIRVIFSDIVNLRNATAGKDYNYLSPQEQKLGLFMPLEEQMSIDATEVSGGKPSAKQPAQASDPLGIR